MVLILFFTHSVNMLTSSIVLGLALAVSASYDCMKPLTKSPDECCPSMPMFVTDDIVRSCGMDENDNTPGIPPCEPFVCILRKGNLLTSDNKIDKANAMSTIRVLYTDEWDPAINLAVPKCLALVETNPSSCEARQFATCFIQNLIMNCPAEHWTTSGECDAAKSFLNECVPPAM